MRGVVVLISNGVAFVYTSESPTELLLDTRIIGNSKIELGQWLDCTAYKTYVERFRKIDPRLKTEVVGGKVQMETRVRVSDSMVFESTDFGKVAYLTQKSAELKIGQIYRCMVTRDVDKYGETYSNLSVKWHILPNTFVPEGLSDVANAKQAHLASIWTPNGNDANGQVMDLAKKPSTHLGFSQNASTLLTGVVVGKRRNLYVIYTRAGFVTMIGRWKRENVEAPQVGQWIQFKSKQIEPKKQVVDSNSFRQVAPQYITTVENEHVNLIVPAHVNAGKIFTEFVHDTNSKEFNGGRLREAKVLVWADEKGRYRWKLAEKQNYLVPREAQQKKAAKEEDIDFSKDVDLAWKHEN